MPLSEVAPLKCGEKITGQVVDAIDGQGQFLKVGPGSYLPLQDRQGQPILQRVPDSAPVAPPPSVSDIPMGVPAAPAAIWQVFTDASGRKYFYNTQTHETSWTDPNLPPPAEWKPVRDAASGRVYYYNTVTRETSWVDPTQRQPAPSQPYQPPVQPVQPVPRPYNGPPTQQFHSRDSAVRAMPPPGQAYSRQYQGYCGPEAQPAPQGMTEEQQMAHAIAMSQVMY